LGAEVLQFADFNPMDYIDGKKRQIVQTVEQLIDLSTRLATCKYFNWDVETTGLHAWVTLKVLTKSYVKQLMNNLQLDPLLSQNKAMKIGDNIYSVIPAARICGHAIMVDGVSYYIPVEHEVEGDMFKNVDDLLFTRYVLPHFYNENVLIVNHNIKFDLHMLRFHYRNIGQIVSPSKKVYLIDPDVGFVPCAKVCDTMVLAHMANENSWEWDKKGRPIFKLKVLGKIFYGTDADDQEQFLKDYMKRNKLERYSQIPIHILGPYAVRDVELVDAVYLGVMKQLVKEWENDTIGLPLERLIEDDMKYLRILEEVYSFGIYIDREMVQRYFDEARQEMQNCRAAIKEMLGGIEFNPGSTSQVRKYCNVENSQEKTLKRMIKDAPDSIEAKIAAKVMEYKSWEKVKGTYYEKYLMLADSKGFIHPELFQVATVTSRLACKNPNFQALPRANDENELLLRIYKVRNVVTPPNPDFVHLYADYSQIEMNISTIYSEDNEMKSAIIGGMDIHLNAAENVFGKDTIYDKVTGKLIKRFRSMAKGINFGTIYGMGAFSFVMNMRDMYGIILTMEEAAGILEKWHGVFQGFRRFYGIAEATARILGHIRLWTGRRRRFVNPETGQLYPKTEYRKAMNNIIQGAVAEMVKQASIRINTILKSETATQLSRLVNFIHDDINMYIHKDDFHLIPAIKAAMEDFPIFTSSGIPVVVDVEFANWKGSWGKKGHWKPGISLEEVFAVEEGQYNPPVKETPVFKFHLPVDNYKPTIFKQEDVEPTVIDPKADHKVVFAGVTVATTKYKDPYLRFDFTKVDDPWHFGKSMSQNIFISNKKAEEYMTVIKDILDPLGATLEDLREEDGRIHFNSQCAFNHVRFRKVLTANCGMTMSGVKTYMNAVNVRPAKQDFSFTSHIPSPIRIA
jgi:DNA polymerase I-like protein with 3'-5' exonuclease and polymerase domains